MVDGEPQDGLKVPIGTGTKVLVVDDEKDVRDFLEVMLEGDGYTVLKAHDGQDALRRVLLDWPKLIILDLRMPIMSGWEFLKVRAEHPALARIPVIVISEFGEGVQAEAVHRRPFDVGKLLADVKRLID
jgi:CheY-like chemotaxis protein